MSMDGKELWRFTAGGPIFDFPSFHEKKIYIGSYDCYFYCIDEIGEKIWRFATSSNTIAPRGKAHETFKVEIKHETRIEEPKKDKYKEKGRKSEIDLELSVIFDLCAERAQ